MRLIDADSLRARMYHDAFEVDSDFQKWESGCWIRYKMFENAIEDAPTIDAVEVVHGKWRRKMVDNGFNIDWVCSKCGYRVMTDFVSYNYCPNCGARMKGADDE